MSRPLRHPLHPPAEWAAGPARPVDQRRLPSLHSSLKSDRNKKCSAAAAAAVVTTSPITVPVKQRKNDKPTTKSCKKQAKRAKNSNPNYYSEVAVALENIYKTSPGAAELGYGGKTQVVRNESSRKSRRVKRRLRLQKKEISTSDLFSKEEEEEEEEEKLVRGYSGTSSREFASLDWRRMKIPAVIGSTELDWLFKLMQPMKAIFKVAENLRKNLNREAMEGELAAAVNMKVAQLRRHIEVGQAARNKLIKHNLRLVLFAINKYYQELAGSDKLQDLCQAGVKGLITAIDRFGPKRGFRISTYGLLWIRHSITQSMTVSSFTHVSFGIESVRQKIRKAKLELIVELQRSPTEEEIIGRIGISAERYRDVIKASKSVYSLNARHIVTQEEFINGISDDIVGAGVDKLRQSTLLKFALDDVLDSLKPKESMVIRQRYGLDGRGDPTLGEIAGNLNISREMVRKYELKALMKLKNPARLDYLQQYI